jgi:uracil-DNA glycosylase family protein
MRQVTIRPTLEDWRRAARRLIDERVPPEEVHWREAEEKRVAPPGLFDPPEPAAVPEPEPQGAPELRVPRAFLSLAQTAAASRDPDRWRLLYSVLWRIAAGDRDLLLRRDDADLRRLRDLADAAPTGSAGGAQPFVPPTSDLRKLAAAAASCQGCDLYRHATQTVFGRGPASARAVLVGEAPGDQEDLQGAPFVGPAGEVLDRALAAAGLPREELYVTNAVKHFKFVRTPKRRIHQTPNSAEMEACRPWLAAELSALSPRVLVCLGATASKALLGPGFRLMKERGRFLDSTLAPRVLATFHPSAVLRAEDEAGRSRVYETLVADLKLAAGVLRA